MDSVGNKAIHRKNPRATAGILSALTFAWTLDLFRRGIRRDLTISDLCEPLPEHTARLLGNKFEELWNKELEAFKTNPKRRPSLLRVIFKAYGGKIVLYIVVNYVSDFIFRLGQPLLLSRMLQHFCPNSTVTADDAKLYAAGMMLCRLGNLVTIPPCVMASAHLGMKVRVATSSLIYRKSLRLSQQATTNIGAGHLINILSNDASRFDDALIYMPQVVLSPLLTAVVAYVVWVEAGPLALIGITILCSFVPLQAVLAKQIASLRRRIAQKTDCRIRLMGEIIAGIQVIKMYAWEKSFAKVVALARQKEINIIQTKSYTVGFLNTASSFSTKVALFGSLLAYALSGYDIQANVIYAMVMCFSIIDDNLTNSLPTAIMYAAESYVSIGRMEQFLLNEEATEAIEQTQAPDVSKGAVETKDLCAKWSSGNAENTLDQLNVKIRTGSLNAVIGAVGSGKSSFLQLILREIPVISGSLKVGGTVSYASQEPWLFAGTVRQNILFGLPMDREKYQKVARACALKADFKQLPHGDRTIIGDRGVCLSGGQRARVNLARAVYRDADIYLLDDPLSAVDPQVARHLFELCICRYLSGKTVVLATHHVQQMANVGDIIKLEGGKVVAQGSFKELCETGFSLEEPRTKEDQEESGRRLSLRKMSIMDIAEGELLPKDTETRSTGSVGASIYLTYLRSVKNIALVISVVASFILVIVATSGSDYWLSFWVNKEEDGFPTDDIIPVVGEFNRNIGISVYAMLVGGIIAFVVLRTILYSVLCMRASTNLHDTMFRTISQATMNFFNVTPAGQILNRFSRDVGIIDEDLPETLRNFVRVGLQVLGSLVIIFVVNYYLMIPFIAMILVLYTLRHFYVLTSRSMKRIESVTRSPIYTHVNASLQGLSTIRAMRTQSCLHEEFDQKLDAHSSAWYYILGTKRAFAYHLDLICCLYIGSVTFSFFVLDNEFLGGDVGLAITQSMGLTFLFQWCIRQSAEVENLMTAVERVCEFSKVESEEKNLKPPASYKKLFGWPSRGAIQFSNVSLFYDDTGSAVLRNVSFDIKPGEKIGVVGRTGAGKSSLIAALFRLQKIEGNINVDGIETSSIDLWELRSRISIIPQDPVIFSGTMRFNLDPFEEYKDHHLWNVLQEVELKYIVKDNPLGLETNLSEGGVNLSVGQRQLVCLARAILRNSAVLVLDEATANVDAETDDFIQKAIRKRFAHCTVITIAHRLHTVMESDRILVMDNGKVAEFGPPQVLLTDPKGLFSQMVELAGPLASTLAEQNQPEKNRPSG